MSKVLGKIQFDDKEYNVQKLSGWEHLPVPDSDSEFRWRFCCTRNGKEVDLVFTPLGYQDPCVPDQIPEKVTACRLKPFIGNPEVKYEGTDPAYAMVSVDLAQRFKEASPQRIREAIARIKFVATYGDKRRRNGWGVDYLIHAEEVIHHETGDNPIGEFTLRRLPNSVEVQEKERRQRGDTSPKGLIGTTQASPYEFNFRGDRFLLSAQKGTLYLVYILLHPISATRGGYKAVYEAIWGPPRRPPIEEYLRKMGISDDDDSEASRYVRNRFNSLVKESFRRCTSEEGDDPGADSDGSVTELPADRLDWVAERNDMEKLLAKIQTDIHNIRDSLLVMMSADELRTLLKSEEMLPHLEFDQLKEGADLLDRDLDGDESEMGREKQRLVADLKQKVQQRWCIAYPQKVRGGRVVWHLQANLFESEVDHAKERIISSWKTLKRSLTKDVQARGFVQYLEGNLTITEKRLAYDPGFIRWEEVPE